MTSVMNSIHMEEAIKHGLVKEEISNKYSFWFYSLEYKSDGHLLDEQSETNGKSNGKSNNNKSKMPSSLCLKSSSWVCNIYRDIIN